MTGGGNLLFWDKLSAVASLMHAAGVRTITLVNTPSNIYTGNVLYMCAVVALLSSRPITCIIIRSCSELIGLPDVRVSACFKNVPANLETRRPLQLLLVAAAECQLL